MAKDLIASHIVFCWFGRIKYSTFCCSHLDINDKVWLSSPECLRLPCPHLFILTLHLLALLPRITQIVFIIAAPVERVVEIAMHSYQNCSATLILCVHMRIIRDIFTNTFQKSLFAISSCIIQLLFFFVIVLSIEKNKVFH